MDAGPRSAPRLGLGLGRPRRPPAAGHRPPATDHRSGGESRPLAPRTTPPGRGGAAQGGCLVRGRPPPSRSGAAEAGGGAALPSAHPARPRRKERPRRARPLLARPRRLLPPGFGRRRGRRPLPRRCRRYAGCRGAREGGRYVPQRRGGLSAARRLGAPCGAGAARRGCAPAEGGRAVGRGGGAGRALPSFLLSLPPFPPLARRSVSGPRVAQRAARRPGPRLAGCQTPSAGVWCGGRWPGGGAETVLGGALKCPQALT